MLRTPTLPYLLFVSLAAASVACSPAADRSVLTDPVTTPEDEETGTTPEEDATPAEPEDTHVEPTEDTFVPKPDTAVAKKDSGTSIKDTGTAVEDTGTLKVDTSVPPTDAGGCELPTRDCVGTSTYCMELLPFEPKLGPGYDDYPINGETAANQYRSYARRDLQMLVKYAAAYVECKGKHFTPGNGKPLGLGDMSEKTGAIPGTSIGSPGHPAGTHLNGNDMDIAYYQTTSIDNKLRPICPHKTGTTDQYHCTGAPDILDVQRTAMFLGAFLTSPRVRVIGVDGKVGVLVTAEMQKQCDAGLLPKTACDKKAYIAYEVTDTGKGWYLFHHHHFHVSLSKAPSTPTMFAPLTSMPPLVAEGFDPTHDLDRLRTSLVPGHACLAE